VTDPVIQKRNRANKRRGSAFEVGLREFLKSSEFDVERIARKGKRDIGDLVLVDDIGHHWVIEAKDVARNELSKWVAEAAVEADHYAEHARIDRGLVHWVVVWKRRGQPLGKAYVITDLNEWVMGL
jgi:Holliday junction resolvase